ncbi:MAG: tetratricopeptide repeat protein [Deltaproteobacteria bacterium]|jgi:thioredoxin-like negative regulator of GroEL|nr:tetratricopeptide repeat protein [Deltaproteobacteria bacterium]
MEPQVNTGGWSPEADINHVLEGEKLFAQGQSGEARAMFQKAVDLCPGNVQAWNNLAVVSLSGDHLAEAEGYLKKALEIKPEFLEARFNLAEVHTIGGQFHKAAKELKKILDFKPDDLPTVKRLAQIYLEMGLTEEARAILDDSDNLGSMRAFIDSLWLGIKFFAMAEDLTPRARLENLMLAVLKLIDGQDGRSQVYHLVGEDPVDGKQVVLSNLSEHFYYKENRELQKDPVEKNEVQLVLTIGEHEDWAEFHKALKNEMRAEGGCLGDFTQTKKVLRQDRFRKYDLSSTLDYFRLNVGPCDCHVVRAHLV